jgi:hypothetical protein
MLQMYGSLRSLLHCLHDDEPSEEYAATEHDGHDVTNDDVS